MKCLFAMALFFSFCSSAFAQQKYSGKIIDTHGHVWFDDAEAKAIFPIRPGTADANLESLKKTGISRAGIIVMATVKGDMVRTRKLNDQVVEFSKKHPDLVYPIGSVHPDDGDDALKELERLANLKIRVIKLHPNVQLFDVASENVSKLAKKAGELGLILLFDGYAPLDSLQMDKFARLAMTNPKTKFIIAHMGGPRFQSVLAFQALALYGFQRNVWFDLSWYTHHIVTSPYKDQFVWVAREVGVDRLLFGSDFPFVSREDAIKDISSLGFKKDELEKIFHANAEELLGK
ncbi:MAG: amidohydrolase family protein [Oligoflexales bacterium]